MVPSAQSAFRRLNQVVLPLAESGLVSPPPVGLGLVVLETTGRKSGKIRKVPLLAARFGGRLSVSTVRGDSQWLANLEADSSAAVWQCGKRREARTSVTRGPLNVVDINWT